MLHHAAPAYSLPKTKRQGVLELSESGLTGFVPPPPTAYDPKPIASHLPHASMGRSNRQQISGLKGSTSEAVGPGSYTKFIVGEPNQNPQANGPAFTIFKAERLPAQQFNNPSPNTYQPNQAASQSARAMSYSMGSRYETQFGKQNNIPGPGAYTCESLQKAKSISSSKKVTTFSGAQRFMSHKALPGPGDYEIIKPQKSPSFSNCGSIGKSPRDQPNRQIAPAPNEYSQSSQFGQQLKGPSMGLRSASSLAANTETSQAFGKYIINSTKPGKGFSIGKERRQIFQDNGLPACTDYQVNKPDRHHFAGSLTTSRRHSLNKDALATPGPGAYQLKANQIPTIAGEASKKTTLPRSQSHGLLSFDGRIGIRNETGPGVGAYLIAPVSKGACSFARSQRTNFVSPNKAGVGDYNLKLVQAKKGSFSKAGRFSSRTQRLPGPGDYNHQHTLANLHFYPAAGSNLRSSILAQSARQK